MRTMPFFLFVVVAAALPAFAQDLRTKVIPVAATPVSELVVPGVSVFGLPWGATEAVLVQKLGQPFGYLALTNGLAVLVYSSTIYLILREDKLVGIDFGGQLLPYTMSRILPSTSISTLRPTLNNQVYAGLLAPEVKRLVGKSAEFSAAEQKMVYEEKGCTVVLTFFGEQIGSGPYDPATLPEEHFRLDSVTVLQNDCLRFLGNPSGHYGGNPAQKTSS